MGKLLIGKVTKDAKNMKELIKPPVITPGESPKEATIRYDLSYCVENKTQKVFKYYANFNMLPQFIIKYDKSKTVAVKMFRQLFWKDEYGVPHLIPLDINNKILDQYRKGILETKVEFESRPGDDEPQKFKIVLSGKKNEEMPFYMETLSEKSGRKIPLQIRDMGEKELKSKLFTSIIDDFNSLSKIVNSFTFSDTDCKKTVIECLEEIKDIEKININKIKEIKCVPLAEESEEYKLVKTRFMDSMSTMKSVKIIEISKIQNYLIKINYLIQKIYIAIKTNQINEKQLFHGTSTTDPIAIYTDSVGFDMRFSSNSNLWGRAIYFAEKSIYSHSSYSFIVNSKTNERQMFLADVILGRHTEQKKIAEKDLTCPSVGYDSVYAVTGGSDVYMLYENNRAYPKYLIKYTH